MIQFIDTIKWPNTISEDHSQPSQTSKMELLAKIVNSWNLLTISAKTYILDVWLGSEYACVFGH